MGRSDVTSSNEARNRVHRLLELLREQLEAQAHASRAVLRTFDAIVEELDSGPEPRFRTCAACSATYPSMAVACPVCHVAPARDEPRSSS